MSDARFRYAVRGYPTVAPVSVSTIVDMDVVDVSTLRRGWGAMLSAPGYLDRTDMSVHATEADAEEFLKETYPEPEEES